MSFGIKEEKLVSAEDRSLLKWVKENKDRIDAMKREESIPTATAVEMYDDSKLQTQVDKLGKRLSLMEKEEEKEKPYFERVEKSVNENKRDIAGLKIVVQQVAKGGKTARDKIIQDARNGREQLAKAIKIGLESAEKRQQEDITKRMEAMREEVEKNSYDNKMALEEVKLRQAQLNKRVNEVLNARSKVFKRG